jgi:hypothetical protein
MYRFTKNILQNPLTQHRWMWRVWSGLILLMGAPTLLAHKIRSLLRKDNCVNDLDSTSSSTLMQLMMTKVTMFVS